MTCCSLDMFLGFLGPGAVPLDPDMSSMRNLTSCFCVCQMFAKVCAWFVGVRDCPYGICCPWVRGGWGLDALGKFFRRRRAFVFRQILDKKSSFLVISHENDMLGHLLFRRSFFENVFKLFSPIAGGSRVE